MIYSKAVRHTENNKMTKLNSLLPVITLHVHGLNALIKGTDCQNG